MAVSYKELGMKIRNSRKENDITTKSFAQLLNISVGQLSNIENGNYDVFKLELLYKISDLLDIPLEGLLELNINNLENFLDNSNKNSKSQSNYITKLANTLVISFLATIYDYNYDKDKAEVICNHLIKELKFIKKINTNTKDVSTL
ncbi:MAG: helix-turn-helix transcriptional regulator [Firmicutes bacterium]|nr:helix-turn-helix transcriptional regulator [Bacillota bacterium]